MHVKCDRITDKHILKIKRDLLLTPEKQNNTNVKTYYTESAEPFVLCSEGIGNTMAIPLYYGKEILKLSSDTQKTEFPFMETSVQLRDYQKKVFNKALKYFVQYGTVTLKTFPGSGKTLMCTLLSSASCGLVCILVHLTVQPRQWLTTIEKAFPDFSEKVWIVGENECPEDVRFIICMIKRTEKIPLELKKLIGCLIIDEAHLLCVKSAVEPILSFDVPRVIVATATLERTDGMEKMMHLIAGEHSILLINKSPHLIFRFETELDFELVKNKQGVTDYSKLVKQKANSKERNQKGVSFILSNPHRKFIVLTSIKEHAEKFYRLCKDAGIECDKLYGTKKKYEDSQVLIGTLPKIGTAFDEENGCETYRGRKSDTLMLLTSFKTEYDEEDIKNEKLSKVKTWEQVRGRVMRTDNPCIVYFVDQDRISRSHFNKGKKWFDYTNGKIIKINDPLYVLPKVGMLE